LLLFLHLDSYVSNSNYRKKICPIPSKVRRFRDQSRLLCAKTRERNREGPTGSNSPSPVPPPFQNYLILRVWGHVLKWGAEMGARNWANPPFQLPFQPSASFQPPSQALTKLLSHHPTLPRLRPRPPRVRAPVLGPIPAPMSGPDQAPVSDPFQAPVSGPIHPCVCVCVCVCVCRFLNLSHDIAIIFNTATTGIGELGVSV